MLPASRRVSDGMGLNGVSRTDGTAISDASAGQDGTASNGEPAQKTGAHERTIGDGISVAAGGGIQATQIDVRRRNMARKQTAISPYQTSAMLIELIHARYPSREYAFFTQAASNTGGPADRTADALSLSLWPSRGLVLTGFEVKVSRGDWTRELRAPEKAERIAQYCDLWFIVTNDGVVPIDQIPEKWGLMVPNKSGDGLRVIKPASRLKAKPLDRSFVAALLRNVGDTMMPVATFTASVENARLEGIVKGEKHTSDGHELERLRKVEDAVKKFHEASGLMLSDTERWDGHSAKAIGETIKLLISGDREMEWRLQAIESSEKVCRELLTIIRKQLDAMRTAKAALKWPEKAQET